MPASETDVLLGKIDSFDWSKFDGPDMYSAANVRDTLRSLVQMNSGRASQSLGHHLLNALGNDHSGEYYPVVIAALDIVIEIAECADNKPRQMCARAALNNLYYFEPHIGSYSAVSEDELRSFVKKKLEPYSDDNWDRVRA